MTTKLMDDYLPIMRPPCQQAIMIWMATGDILASWGVVARMISGNLLGTLTLKIYASVKELDQPPRLMVPDIENIFADRG